ncbi:MAG TPA: VanZ family protein [Thermoanaerobaculia bacterium]|nr:VanZ family protein [Thermoanaerobaculia bacterium]
MKVVRVGKKAQAALLLTYSVALLVVTLVVQGGNGVRVNLEPFADVKRLVDRVSRGDVLSNAFLYAIVGIAGNLVMFAIWAFLAFKFLDEKGRPTWWSHVAVIFSGILFSVGIETVQLFLPTRAADVNDVFWNALGSVVGSLTAYFDREVTLSWE